MRDEQRKKLKSKCKNLRRSGYSLGRILEVVALPKTTVYGYIKDIALTAQQKDAIDKRKRLLRKSKPNIRKGKCIPGRGIRRPLFHWNLDLVHIVAHFIFDGRISRDGCAYYSRSPYQIKHLKDIVHNIFGIEPKYTIRKDGVRVVYFYNVEFADYIREKAKEIFSYIKNEANKESKRIFAQAFFDDEGNVYYNKSYQRRIRGYQNLTYILNDIRNILSDFAIKSKIYSGIKAIEITGKENLVNFAKEINFAPFIFLNPERRNSIWRREVSKREVLNLAIASYKS